MKRLFPFSLGLVFLFMSLCVQAAYPDMPDNYSITEFGIDAHVQVLSKHINELCEYFKKGEQSTNYENSKAIEPNYYMLSEAISPWWTYYDPNGRWSIKFPDGWVYDYTDTYPDYTAMYFLNASSNIACSVADFESLGPLPGPLEEFVTVLRDEMVDGFIILVSDVAPITTNEGNTGYEFTIRVSSDPLSIDTRTAFFTNNEGELFGIILVYETGNLYTGNNTEIIKSLELGIAGMPLPTEPTTIPHDPEDTPVVDIDPLSARPFSFGDISSGTATIRAAFPAFEDPVDIYLAIDALPHGVLYLIDESGNLTESTTPWRTNKSDATNITIFEIPVVFLIPGDYWGYTIVVPAGTDPATFDWDTSAYYMWYFMVTVPQ
ncbi:MAG: hypothetical protein AMJ42_05085 [Deltaproteobacteria bacterium DG_8]|nr:MAG: hypothetical protein AMJ42_05085 [Deltaproteobacteria bacterium DG_8]